MKIYTKGGDKGVASLYNGDRCPKGSPVFDALGDVDELNSVLGMAREHVASLEAKIAEQLDTIQSRLLDVGSYIATPEGASTDRKLQRVEFDSAATQQLEEWIDEWHDQLPPLSNFILPSGGIASSTLHLARSVCRRAERTVVSSYNLMDGNDTPPIIPYLNRLSDYLFTAARIAALRAKKPETTYCKARA